MNKLVNLLDKFDNSKLAERIDNWLDRLEEKYEYYYELLIKKMNKLAEPLYALARDFEARHYRIEVIEKIKDLVHKPKH